MKMLASMLVLTVATVAFANDSPEQGGLSSSVVLNKLHAINQHEIEGGRMAQAQAVTQEVRSFGERMVQDHSEADAEVTRLAEELKVNVVNPMRSDLPGLGQAGDEAQHDRHAGVVQGLRHRIRSRLPEHDVGGPCGGDHLPGEGADRRQ